MRSSLLPVPLDSHLAPALDQHYELDFCLSSGCSKLFPRLCGCSGSSERAVCARLHAQGGQCLAMMLLTHDPTLSLEISEICAASYEVDFCLSSGCSKLFPRLCGCSGSSERAVCARLHAQGGQCLAMMLLTHDPTLSLEISEICAASYEVVFCLSSVCSKLFPRLCGCSGSSERAVCARLHAQGGECLPAGQLLAPILV